MAKPLTTVLSTKGQVILPKALRDRRNWTPGVCLQVEETEDGLLLKRAPLFESTNLDDVFAVLKRPGVGVSLEEMDEALLAEAARRAGD
ncbi:MAG: AbrB/MazE/SpoVT family DNA-binding domain-containing protein [Phenylobacterium sp.]|uniref:AbrB/MazE/SpoVT family DNA-binding domain-containing protein n=1 Tax=Phenylobacterium sp. TaxID=1871053 RepID=UPI0025FB0C90|nr:AbrB/MazE/SpoVT family DNA-binding domain-containing protein [Phenylobacterium sp.]MCG9915963.1 AbrB/MazE/SpoVT family DNA-binding domain-containing protein [Phenylobacterium sp.]